MINETMVEKAKSYTQGSLQDTAFQIQSNVFFHFYSVSTTLSAMTVLSENKAPVREASSAEHVVEYEAWLASGGRVILRIWGRRVETLKLKLATKCKEK